MASTRRKSAAIALAVVGIAGLSLASAATLNVNSGSLGAATAVVASCQATDDDPATTADAIDVSFTTSYVGDAYVTTAVALSNVSAACDGNDVKIQLTDGTDVIVGANAVGTIDGANVYTLVTPADAELVEGYSIVISG